MIEFFFITNDDAGAIHFFQNERYCPVIIRLKKLFPQTQLKPVWVVVLRKLGCEQTCSNKLYFSPFVAGNLTKILL